MGQIQPTNRPFVFVFWQDPHSLAATEIVNERDVSNLHKAAEMITAGWVLKQDAVGISVAGEYCGDGDYRSTTYVLMSLVTEVKVIKLTAARKPRTPKTAPVATVLGD